MLGRYFVRVQTVDRIRALWLGPEIERYVVWLWKQGYNDRTVLRRVPLLAQFGEFARARGAAAVEDLPAHVEAFVAEWLGRWRPVRGGASVLQLAKEARGPIEQMLELVVAGFKAPVGGTVTTRSLKRCRGSSSTWSQSAVFGLLQSASTVTTFIASPPTSTGSVSANWERSLRRS